MTTSFIYYADIGYIGTKYRTVLALKQMGVSLPDDIVRRLSDDAADLQIPISALCRILILHSLDKCDLKGIAQDRDKNEF